MIPLYVMDSILKNVGGVFTRIVMQNLPAVFSGAFAHVDNAIRASMIKLLDTWQTQAVFPPHLIDDIRARLAGVQCAVYCHSGYEWAAAALGEGDVLVLAAAVLAQQISGVIWQRSHVLLRPLLAPPPRVRLVVGGVSQRGARGARDGGQRRGLARAAFDGDARRPAAAVRAQKDLVAGLHCSTAYVRQPPCSC